MAVIRLYSAQRPQILDILNHEGVYRVKQHFIDRKYGESAWIFNEAYSFFREKASALVSRPKDADSAVWLFQDPRNAASEGCILLCFDIPEELVIPFDMRLWYKILNLSYIGNDEADEKRFAGELQQMGIRDHCQLFSTPFYPMQKQAVKESWSRLFAPASCNCDPAYRQVGVWELRREWLVQAE